MELSLCKSTVTEAMEKHLCGFLNPENSWTTSLLNEEHDVMDHRILGLEGPQFTVDSSVGFITFIPLFFEHR